MQIVLIAEFEVSVRPNGEPALAFHHVIRDRTVATFELAAAQELRDLLAIEQKRIRVVGGCQVIFGAGGDLTIYSPNGQRAVYLNDFQAGQLSALLQSI